MGHRRGQIPRSIWEFLAAIVAFGIVACESEPATGDLGVRVEPWGAYVFANGDCVTTTPLTASLPPGEYLVQVRRGGFQPFDTTITIVAGSTTEIRGVELQPDIPIEALMADEEPEDMRDGEPVPWEDSWVGLPDAVHPRIMGASTVLGNRIYTFGGYGPAENKWDIIPNAVAYEPSDEKWVEFLQPMPTPRTNLAAAAVEPLIYVIGGSTENGLTGVVEAFNTMSATWRTVAPLPTPRYSLAAAARDGIVYVAGGFDGDVTSGALECYDPTTDTWTELPDMPTPRTNCAAVFVGKYLYVIGGADRDGPVATVERFDTETDTWQAMPDMPTARQLVVAGNIRGRIFVAGGLDREGGMGETYDPLPTLEAYIPSEDRWATLTPMPTPRSTAAGGVLGWKLYVVGGFGRYAHGGAPFAGRLRTIERFEPVEPFKG